MIYRVCSEEGAGEKGSKNHHEMGFTLATPLSPERRSNKEVVGSKTTHKMSC